jgi:tetratricopeptide (TPR) repeat protein
MSSGIESPVERMRTQAERAMASSKSRNTILPLLERLARAAPAGSEASAFAHRHLAEYLVEQNPWRALVHLRRVLGPPPPQPPAGARHPHGSRGGSASGRGTREGEHDDGGDDGAHALAGLAHALLGNYHSAVAAYRRAIAIAPRNPWYQHNLGHLLDVGLDRPKVALRHLEAAHRAAGPDDGEISASLAHCLARLGEMSAALGHIEVAITTCPDNAEHRRLHAWILGGAKPKEAPASSAASSASPSSDSSAPARDEESSDLPQPQRPPKRGTRKRKASAAPDGQEHDQTAVGRPATSRRRAAMVDKIATLIEARMRAAGHPSGEVEHASRLWEDYAATLPSVSIRREGVDLWAALTEYAITRRTRGAAAPPKAGQKPRVPSITAVARRHGVSSENLSRRWAELETVLARWAKDPSYARS